MKHRLWLWLPIAASFGVACGNVLDETALGGETNWFAKCTADAQCAVGSCLCGVCTTPCSPEAAACASGPSGSACFGAGSAAHAAVCADSAAQGLCLRSCASDMDCGAELGCASGACVPQEVAAAASNGGPSAIDAGSATETPEAPPTLPPIVDDWFIPNRLLAGAEQSSELTCRPFARCPTLEEALLTGICHHVSAGCGLYNVTREGLVVQSYWYEGPSAVPVAFYTHSDVGEARFESSRSVACADITVSCSTCGSPPCRNVPGAYPEFPVPSLPEVCSCEPEGETSARVSLDCFCATHGCPLDLSEALSRCGEREALDLSADTCGQIWIQRGPPGNSVRFAYSAGTGQLLGATSVSGAPLVAPCNAYEVSAGNAVACEISEECDCDDGETANCPAEPWVPSPPVAARDAG